MTKADPLGTLISWSAELRAEDLPAPVLSAAKAYLINTLAAMLGGSTAPGAVEVMRQVESWGGQPESTVVAYGFKLPAPLAALANGVMAHALDYDDTQVGTGFHPNVSIVPALLAAAESLPAGRAVNGSTFLAAYVSALEIACRMTLAATNRAGHPWLTTTLFGVLGAALAAGRVQSLPISRLRHALGIAYSSAGGNRQGLLDGAMIQRVQPGLAAQAGVSAVALARQGITGAHDVLEGRYGLYPSYYGTDYEPKNLLDGLGREFRMVDLALKPYPCCSYSQEPIEAATEIAREHGFRCDAVKEVAVSVASRHAAGLVDRAYAPRSCAQVDAQFSMQYVVAAALLRGSVGLKDFQEDALHERAVIDYAKRIHVMVDERSPNTVIVTMHDGTKRVRQVRTALGHPERPFSAQQLRAKLSECASFAAQPDALDAQAIYDSVIGLENLTGIGRLVKLIAPQGPGKARAAR